MELKEKDSAIIFKEDGQFELSIPHMDDYAEVTDNVLLTVLIGILMIKKDKDLIALLEEKRSVYFPDEEVDE